MAVNSNSWLQPPVLTSLVVGGYGAVLATISFLRTVWLDRRSGKVWLGTTMLFSDQGDAMFFLTVNFVNQRHRPITIAQLTVQLPDGMCMANVDGRLASTPLPITLKDGQNAVAHYAEENVLSALRRRCPEKIKVKPLARDAAGREYRGKAIKLPRANGRLGRV